MLNDSSKKNDVDLNEFTRYKNSNKFFVLIFVLIVDVIQFRIVILKKIFRF